MPDFKVIHGSGKKRDADGGWSRHHLHSLVIELLRALARGDDSQQRVASDLAELFEHLSKISTPLTVLVDEVMAELHHKIAPRPDNSHHDDAMKSIIISSLRVAAESLCHDPAAKGRRGRRKSDLDRDIRRLITRREQEARSRRES